MIYLDNAATTFLKPDIVFTRVMDCLKNYGANPGRGGHKLALRASQEVYRTREAAAEFFNILDPLRVIFTSNCTDSLNLALKGSLKPGDHVITTAMDHNSMLRPISALKKTGVEATILPCDENGHFDLKELEAAIQKNTKLIAMTHASNLIGSMHPISKVGEICKKHNLLFLVDAAQSAGVYPIDVQKMNIDLLAAPGHKSLFSIQGMGILYVGERAELEMLKQGGTGSRSEEIVHPDLLPDKYESGTLNVPGIVSLCAGIEYINEVGINTVCEHETSLSQYFMEKLLNIDDIIVYGEKNMQNRAPAIAINVKNVGSSEVAFALDDEFSICTRGGLHCAPFAHKSIGTVSLGAVRFSIGYFNTKKEIDTSVSALKKIIDDNK
jgi:cysteine desulfurase/selenocysteine lyase